MRAPAIDRAVASRCPRSAASAPARRPRAPLPEAGDIALVLDCPFCGRPAAYPRRGKGGEPAMAECDRCDVYFDFTDDEVYVADAMPAPGELAA